jgi:methylase of polypeptide subunit release factors
MCFEIGYNQKQKLSDFLEEKKLLKYTTFYEDFSGLDRILIIGIKR